MKKTSFEIYIEEKLNKNPVLREKVKKAEIGLDIAYQISSIRQEKGLTQQELAHLVNINQSNIARLENAEYSGYSLKTLQKIAGALGSNLSIIMASPEETSTVLSFLHNTKPTITEVMQNNIKYYISLIGSLSFSKTEQFDLRQSAWDKNINISLSPNSSHDYQYLSI
jgi:transcriptional regulator with XRE-family HTH domain